VVKNALQTPSECPVCGEAVPAGAKACPGCGADERSGWDEDATRYDGLNLPEEAFDDKDLQSARTHNGRSPLWVVVAVILLAALILIFVIR